MYILATNCKLFIPCLNYSKSLRKSALSISIKLHFFKNIILDPHTVKTWENDKVYYYYLVQVVVVKVKCCIMYTREALLRQSLGLTFTWSTVAQPKNHGLLFPCSCF